MSFFKHLQACRFSDCLYIGDTNSSSLPEGAGAFKFNNGNVLLAINACNGKQEGAYLKLFSGLEFLFAREKNGKYDGPYCDYDGYEFSMSVLVNDVTRGYIARFEKGSQNIILYDCEHEVTLNIDMNNDLIRDENGNLICYFGKPMYMSIGVPNYRRWLGDMNTSSVRYEGEDYYPHEAIFCMPGLGVEHSSDTRACKYHKYVGSFNSSKRVYGTGIDNFVSDGGDLHIQCGTFDDGLCTYEPSFSFSKSERCYILRYKLDTDKELCIYIDLSDPQYCSFSIKNYYNSINISTKERKIINANKEVYHY